ncbi:DNA polymerase [Thiohalorhabdus denitrificans]|uniref:Type-4 uracil-DNA glycosylase n=1 Tax=Thiohalorhabdus denitrificans TaxID=381306 RepID=A0A1G5B0Z1_9GAMM|nr:DNA polymerase [Thiohalorhabdus denitrificans]
MDARSQRIYLSALGTPLYRRRSREAAPDDPTAPAMESQPPLLEEEGGDYGPLAPEGREGALAALREEVAGCTACPLHESRTQTVFGVGDPHARVMFVGEAPGGEEDRRGEPFVGRAGQLLDAMLASLGLDRKEGGVFIANVLKCRPPNNRDPKPEEVAQCAGYLRRQIELVQPRVLVALGRVAAQQLLGSQQPLARLRGQEHRFHETPVLVTYHPAYLLRNPADKAKAWEDLKAVRRRAAGD